MLQILYKEKTLSERLVYSLNDICLKDIVNGCGAQFLYQSLSLDTGYCGISDCGHLCLYFWQNINGR